MLFARWLVETHDDSFEDRKSTRLNSSHMSISYAVFCLKKKNIIYAYTVCWFYHHHFHDFFRRRFVSVFFFFNDTATTEIYTLSLHDALRSATCASRCLLLATAPRRQVRRRPTSAATRGQTARNRRVADGHRRRAPPSGRSEARDTSGRPELLNCPPSAAPADDRA